MPITDPAPAWIGPLLQFSSANLPVGAFSYSQGLEWAIDAKWVSDAASLHGWCEDWIDGPLACQDLPLLQRLYGAIENDDSDSAWNWSQIALAFRETRELREEERTRARAVGTLLENLLPEVDPRYSDTIHCTPLAGLAYAAVALGLPCAGAQSAHAWGWLENTVLVGVKHIPLGQSAGQRAMMQLWPNVHRAIETASRVADDEIGYSLAAASFASAAHESQYSRLYRS